MEALYKEAPGWTFVKLALAGLAQREFAVAFPQHNARGYGNVK